jgi:hypothetical protein
MENAVSESMNAMLQKLLSDGTPESRRVYDIMDQMWEDQEAGRPETPKKQAALNAAVKQAAAKAGILDMDGDPLYDLLCQLGDTSSDTHRVFDETISKTNKRRHPSEAE